MAPSHRPLLPAPRPSPVSVALLGVGFLGLIAVSAGLWAAAPPLDTMPGRHQLAGALANTALVMVGLAIVLGPYRRGERWARRVLWVPVLAYGVPILCVDGVMVGWRTGTTLLNAALLAPFLVGLLWDRRR